MKECGHCVISGFYLLKEVRNLDFNMSSHFFFQRWFKQGFLQLLRQYGIFFSRRHWHPFYLQWLTCEQEVHMLMQIKRRRSGAGDIPSGIKMRIDVYILYVYIPRLSSEDVKNTYNNDNFTLLKGRNFKERIWRNAEIYNGDVSGKSWSFFFLESIFVSRKIQRNTL